MWSVHSQHASLKPQVRKGLAIPLEMSVLLITTYCLKTICVCFSSLSCSPLPLPDFVRLAGARVIRTVPENTVIALSKRNVVSALLLSSPRIEWAGKMLARDKLSSQLLLDLGKEAETRANFLVGHFVITCAIADKRSTQYRERTIDGLGEIMQNILVLAKENNMSIDRISLYNKRDQQLLGEFSQSLPIDAKLKTLHWLSKYCEIAFIDISRYAVSALAPQALRKGGRSQMRRL